MKDQIFRINILRKIDIWSNIFEVLSILYSMAGGVKSDSSLNDSLEEDNSSLWGSSLFVLVVPALYFFIKGFAENSGTGYFDGELYINHTREHLIYANFALILFAVAVFTPLLFKKNTSPSLKHVLGNVVIFYILYLIWLVSADSWSAPSWPPIRLKTRDDDLSYLVAKMSYDSIFLIVILLSTAITFDILYKSTKDGLNNPEHSPASTSFKNQNRIIRIPQQFLKRAPVILQILLFSVLLLLSVFLSNIISLAIMPEYVYPFQWNENAYEFSFLLPFLFIFAVIYFYFRLILFGEHSYLITMGVLLFTSVTMVIFVEFQSLFIFDHGLLDLQLADLLRLLVETVADLNDAFALWALGLVFSLITTILGFFTGLGAKQFIVQKLRKNSLPSKEN